MKILEWLKDSKIVDGFEVVEYKRFFGGFYIKIIVSLSDNSKLYVREYSDIEERNYSYHWQSESNDLICRWDNAPHHTSLFNFPHHKHLNDNTEFSEEMTLFDVLCFIEKSFSK